MLWERECSPVGEGGSSMLWVFHAVEEGVFSCGRGRVLHAVGEGVFSMLWEREGPPWCGRGWAIHAVGEGGSSMVWERVGPPCCERGSALLWERECSPVGEVHGEGG